MDETLKSYQPGVLCSTHVNGIHQVHESIHTEPISYDLSAPTPVDVVNRSDLMIVLCSPRHNKHLDNDNPQPYGSISPVGLRSFVLTEKAMGWIHPARLQPVRSYKW